jgi:hypothetical protein
MSDDEDSGDSDSIKLIFNEEGKIAYGGVLDFGTKAIKLKFSEEELVFLRSDCETAFTSRAQSKGRYSSGSTFFLRADEKPMCALEQLAMSIFRKHSEYATFDEKRSGCEWWTLVLDPEDEVGFHFDRDFGLESNYNTFIHPHIATVTYLSDIGASTVVLNVISDSDDQSPEVVGANELYICKPSTGKHFSFDGKLLHGAPSDIAGNGACNSNVSVRITFLVNIWLNHIPINSKRITKKYLKQLNNSLNLDTLTTSTIEMSTFECDSLSLDGYVSLEFPNGESFYRVNIPKPNKNSAEAIFSCSSVARIMLNENPIDVQKVNRRKKRRK